MLVCYSNATHWEKHLEYIAKVCLEPHVCIYTVCKCTVIFVRFIYAREEIFKTAGLYAFVIRQTRQRNATKLLLKYPDSMYV